MYNLMEKSCLLIVDILYHQSIFCIILFIVIFGLSKFFKEKSPRWQLGLWFIILIRLVLPTDLSLSFSARNLVDDFLVSDNFNASLEKVSDLLVLNYQPNQSSELRMPIQAEGQNGINTPIAREPNIDSHRYLSLPVILSIIWLLGSLTFLFLFLYKIRNVKRVLNHSSLVRDKEIIDFVDYWRQSFKITRRVLIYSSDKFLSPFTVGFFRPKIFIPEPLLKGMDNESINSIIVHEMVHIKHFDHLWLRLQNVLQIIYFFNPVVWYASGQINIARERLCDSVVLERHVIPPKTFGKSVIDVLKFNISGYRRIEPLLCFGSHKNIFEYRIKNILKEKTISKQKSLFIFLIVCLLGLFLLPMSNAKIDANKPEISDESLSLITEKSQTVVVTNELIAEVQDDAITFPETNDKKERIIDQNEAVEVKLPQVSAEEIKKHEAPLKLTSDEKKVTSLVNLIQKPYKKEGTTLKTSTEKIKSQEESLLLTSNTKKVSSFENKTAGSDIAEPEQVSEFSQTVKQPQDFTDDYTARGRSHLGKGEIDDAISDFNRAIELNPENAVAYFSRGNGYYQKGQFDKAIPDYTKAIEINPRYTNAYFSRGYYYLTTEEYGKAVSDYSNAINISPENVYAYNYRGSAYFAQGQYQKAINDFSKAIEIDPGYVSGYQDRGSIYQAQRRFDDAISDYSKVLELNPEDSVTFNYRGIAYFGQKQYQKALVDFNMAIELDPGYVSAYVYRGYCYQAVEEYNKALDDYKTAVGLNPEIDVATTLRNKIVQLSLKGETSDDEKMECRLKRTFLFKKREVCKTKKEWARLEKNAGKYPDNTIHAIRVNNIPMDNRTAEYVARGYQ